MAIKVHARIAPRLTRGYNERLFSGGVRSWYHLARYRWLRKVLSPVISNDSRVIELGCFDAKTLTHLGAKPSYYLGLDAGWENGLNQARRRWEGDPDVELVLCRDSGDMPDRGTFDIAICMETLEHLQDEVLEAYLAKLAELVRGGRLLITVPVERGPVFLMKFLGRLLIGSRDGSRYSFSDVLRLSLGITRGVQRDEHKGFDERKLLAQIGRHFDVQRVQGVFPGLPFACMNLTIGILAVPRE